MGHIFARPGDRVMDAETGKTICKVKDALALNTVLSAGSFHEFEEGEPVWVANQRLDPRCTRHMSNGYGPQIFIEGEWRPD